MMYGVCVGLRYYCLSDEKVDDGDETAVDLLSQISGICGIALCIYRHISPYAKRYSI